MRIGIDVSELRLKSRTGIQNYIIEIINIWIQTYKEHEFYLIASTPITLDFELPNNWKLIIGGKKRHSAVLWNYIRKPQIIKEYKLDVFWAPGYSLPPVVKGVDYYITIFDLVAFRFPQMVKFKAMLKIRLFLKSACKRAKKIIAISQNTANDINQLLGIPREKIVAVYIGGLPSGKTIVDNNERNGLPESLKTGSFFLFISTIEPRKNIPTIIKAFEAYKEKNDKGEYLVLAGRSGWKNKDVFDMIDRSKQKEYIIQPGYINDVERLFLLKNAICLLYPSLYEGFGIPILEAFSQNLPVITSYVSSMPEVGGDGAYYLNNPLDANELEQLMEKVVNLDKNELEELRKHIAIQKQLFSWEKCADEVMGVISENR